MGNGKIAFIIATFVVLLFGVLISTEVISIYDENKEKKEIILESSRTNSDSIKLEPEHTLQDILLTPLW